MARFEWLDLAIQPVSLNRDGEDDENLHLQDDQDGFLNAGKRSFRRIEFSELKGLKFLVQGAQAQVFVGKYESQYVVVKTLRPDFCPHDEEENPLEKELRMLQNLSAHRNVIQNIGHGYYIKNGEERLFLVHELLQGGSLAAHLIRDRKKKKLGKPKIVTFNNSLMWASMIAKGMEHIHKAGITHRDLKPDNIVFTSEGELKIIDFSLAKCLPSRDSCFDDVYEMTSAVGTPRYMAPENHTNDRGYGQAVDVYSFGVILWELLTGKVPFGQMDPFVFKRKLARRELTLPVAEDWPEPVKLLVSSCLHSDPTLRPSFSLICQQLEENVVLPAC